MDEKIEQALRDQFRNYENEELMQALEHKINLFHEHGDMYDAGCAIVAYGIDTLRGGLGWLEHAVREMRVRPPQAKHNFDNVVRGVGEVICVMAELYRRGVLKPKRKTKNRRGL